MQPEVITQIENSELVRKSNFGFRQYHIRCQEKSIRIATYYHVPIYELHNGNFYCDIWSEKEQTNIELIDCSIENIEESLRVVLLENFYQSLTAIEDHYKHRSDFNNPAQNLDNLRDAIETKVKKFLKDL